MSRPWRRAEEQSPFAGSLRDVHQNPLNPPLAKGDSPKTVQGFFPAEGLGVSWAHVMVQRDAAGVWGVPQISLIFPQEWGIKGVEELCLEI